MDKLRSFLRQLRWQNVCMLTLAGILYAIGVTIFLSPVHLYDSGVSGTSMLLSQVTPHFLTLPMFLIVLNVPLFLYGLRKQGAQFTVYGVYGVAIYAIGAFIIEDVLPIDVRSSSPLAQTDLLLCALFGGLICGFATGLSLRFGGATKSLSRRMTGIPAVLKSFRTPLFIASLSLRNWSGWKNTPETFSRMQTSENSTALKARSRIDPEPSAAERIAHPRFFAAISMPRQMRP